MFKSKLINKNVVIWLLIGRWLAASQSETMFQNACQIKWSSPWQYLSDPGSCYASPLKKKGIENWWCIYRCRYHSEDTKQCEFVKAWLEGDQMFGVPWMSYPVKFEFNPMSGLSANAQNLKSGIDGWTNSQGMPSLCPVPPTPSYSVDGGTLVFYVQCCCFTMWKNEIYEYNQHWCCFHALVKKVKLILSHEALSLVSVQYST